MEALHLGYSFAEYARFEREARERHEFVRGLILAMAGGTLEHGRSSAAVISAFGRQLGGRRCKRVRFERTGARRGQWQRVLPGRERRL